MSARHPSRRPSIPAVVAAALALLAAGGCSRPDDGAGASAPPAPAATSPSLPPTGAPAGDGAAASMPGGVASPPPSAVAAANQAGPAETGGAAPGLAVYNATCAACHAAGVAGAPKVGDKVDWGTRLAQGKDVLYQHAIAGYQGAKGVMPAKGGNPSLTDAQVRAAVDYMASR